MDDQPRRSKNPFTMPPEADMFSIRDEEKRLRAIERDRVRNLSVQDKTTRSARMSSARVATSADDMDADHAASMPGSTLQLPSIDKKVKDNMTHYITKKRELGLERMSLATKRQEIKKLDEEAEHAEKRIEQMAEQLKETDGKFNAFLEHTELEHKNAHNRAELESKAKQEKVNEIKKLAAQIAQLETDHRKNEEQLAQCKEFKTFLDQLASVDWLAKTLIELMQEDRRRKIAALLETKYSDAMGEPPTEAEELERQERKKQELDVLCGKAYAEVAAEVHDLLQNSGDDADKVLRDRLDMYDADRVPMFFTEPEQIIQKFVEIEEGNLGLINICQEYEEEIEAVTAQYNQRKTEMAELSRTRQSQMDAIRRQIAAEQTKLKALEDRLTRAGDQKSQEDLRDRISEKIRGIYESLGIGDDATNAGTLGSLTAIEVKLDDMRQFIMTQIDDAFVTKTMKARDKERRSRARQEILNQHRESREKRSRDALARAQAPVKKRVGKPVMWRSRPLDQKKQEVATAVETNMNDEDEFFA